LYSPITRRIPPRSTTKNYFSLTLDTQLRPLYRGGMSKTKARSDSFKLPSEVADLVREVAAKYRWKHNVVLEAFAEAFRRVPTKDVPGLVIRDEK